ncbi:hypothetical protein Ddye_018136 [Dipteronia dyeriana]|uniref:Uncharacterized protein n=1 Tax=Dipteronia dyeriana TaxID=168575 RepID=A0AAD9UA35_9ROSI|nr:hypothetical protein Ddye_018136 [Dipteronia dyeriana]
MAINCEFCGLVDHLLANLHIGVEVEKGGRSFRGGRGHGGGRGGGGGRYGPPLHSGVPNSAPSTSVSGQATLTVPAELPAAPV